MTVPSAVPATELVKGWPPLDDETAAALRLAMGLGPPDKRRAGRPQDRPAHVRSRRRLATDRAPEGSADRRQSQGATRREGAR